MDRKLRHQRSLGHAGLGIDLQTDQPCRPLDAVVVAEIGPAHAAAAERAMRGE